MTDDYDAVEADLMLAELKRMRAELDDLRVVSVGLRDAQPHQIDGYLERLRIIKADIKDAAHRGTLDRKRRRHTRLEQMFFDPAVRQASADFRMRANARPHEWQIGLGDPIFQLSYRIDGLERYIADVSGKPTTGEQSADS